MFGYLHDPNYSKLGSNNVWAFIGSKLFQARKKCKVSKFNDFKVGAAFHKPCCKILLEESLEAKLKCENEIAFIFIGVAFNRVLDIVSKFDNIFLIVDLVSQRWSVIILTFGTYFIFYHSTCTFTIYSK